MTTTEPESAHECLMDDGTHEPPVPGHDDLMAAPTYDYTDPIVGTRVWAETPTGRRVKIEVTAVVAVGPNGRDVYGYRLSRQTIRGMSSPRPYFVPTVATDPA